MMKPYGSCYSSVGTAEALPKAAAHRVADAIDEESVGAFCVAHAFLNVVGDVDRAASACCE